jgi:hypothetical protein
VDFKINSSYIYRQKGETTMRKGLLGLVVLGLLCWAGQASATTITLNNGVVSTTITNGVVTDFHPIGGVNTITAFTFVMYSPDTGAVALSGSDVGYTFKDDKVSLLGGFKADRHDFSKSVYKNGMPHNSSNKLATMYAQFCLVDDDDPLDGRDRRYLDVRYLIEGVDNKTIDNVRCYLVLEGSGTFDENDSTAPGSAWQMVNNLSNIWSGSDPWPATKKVLSAGQTGYIARVGEDDFMSDTAANVWAKVNAGDALPNTIIQGVPGAIAMRIPVSTEPNLMVKGKTASTKAVDVNVDARLEVVPEPCTMGLMLAGLAGLGAMRRRNKK